MDYSGFDAEDFASDDKFIKWVLSPDESSEQYWKTVQENHPRLRFRIQHARSLVLRLKKAEESYPSKARIETLWKKIDEHVQPQIKREKKSGFPYTGIAAALLLLACALYGVFYSTRSYESTVVSVEGNSRELVEEVNSTASVLKVHLQDGSVVYLAPDSRISYPRDFLGLDTRQVTLTGEAFFEVAKNMQKPFQVKAGEITTKVIGTSFRIKAWKNDKKITVSVAEGKVSVFSNAESQKKTTALHEVNGVVLTPNQMVVYESEDASFTRSLVEKPEKINPFDNKLHFDNTPASEVFRSLEKVYGVTIDYNDELLQDCFLTVSFGDEPLFEKMDVVCRTIGANYQLIDGTILVSGNGC